MFRTTIYTILATGILTCCTMTLAQDISSGATSYSPPGGIPFGTYSNSPPYNTDTGQPDSQPLVASPTPTVFDSSVVGTEYIPPLPPHYATIQESQDLAGNPYNIGIPVIPVEPTYRPYRSNWTGGQQPAPSIRATSSQSSFGESKRGFLQSAGVSGIWSPGMGSGDKKLAMSQLDVNATVAMPFFLKKSAIILTPKFQWNNFGWQPNMDGISHNLYHTSLSVGLVMNFGSQYRFIVGMSPSLSSDWKASTKDAFNMPIYGTLHWHLNSTTDILLGVIYLDRKDVPFLPIAGIVWRPNEDLCFEFTAPRPRIAQRFRWFGSQAGNQVSDWLYIGGEVAGGRWAVKPDGADGSVILEYFDYRAMLGYERKIVNTATFGVEAGYIFGRQITSHEISGKFEPSAAPFLRAKLVY